MFRAFLACLLGSGLLAVSTVSAADDTYTIKLYKSKKGDKSEHEHSESTTTNIVFSAGGVEKKQEVISGTKEVYTEELLEKKPGDKMATKLTQTFTVAEKTAKGKTTKTAYAGETVLIEKKGDKYEFSIKGKALEESDAPELFRKFSPKKENEPRNEDFLPDGPVKVGGSWTVPADKSEMIFKSLGEDQMKADPKKSTISGKLVKVYKKDGAQFGTLEVTVTVFVTEMDLGGQFAKTTPESKVVLKGTMDTCIDGTVPFEDGKTETTIDLTAELPNGGSVTIKGTTKATDKEHLVKK